MAEAHVERRLAAVLAADVAGYSRLMGIDEEGTLEALKAHRRELIDPKIAEHRGRIVKTTGDGALVEFASAVDATRCATEIQNTMVERNASIPEGRRVEFRIGINVGDVIIDEGDIFGDGVNLAARLESIAQPGGICLSDDDYRQVRDKLDLNFQNFGEQELKNITRPVRVYRLRPPTTPPGGPDTSNQSSCASRQAVHRRAAVPEHERRSRAGIFRRRHGRRHVIARNSSFTYKGRAIDVKQIGRELGVRYVLEGSVRRVTDRIRSTGQLSDAVSGAHVWAERYDRKSDDIFALQDE
jgi:class 3 adenylate cyclase